MFIFKLTLLGIVLLAISWLLFQTLISNCDLTTKVGISVHVYPMWFKILTYIIIFLFVADILGVISTVIWLLFQ